MRRSTSSVDLPLKNLKLLFHASLPEKVQRQFKDPEIQQQLAQQLTSTSDSSHRLHDHP